MQEDEHENDLPLSANFHEVQVEHFILDLSCNFEKKIFDGSITLFCKFSPCKADKVAESGENFEQIQITEDNFKRSRKIVCLDCFAIDIYSCSSYSISANQLPFVNTDYRTISPASLQIRKEYMNIYLDLFKCFQNSNTYQPVSVDYEVSKHCLKIYLPHDVDDKTMVVLKISYRTQEKGPSLTWTKDQDGRLCLFTNGHMLNNRSLFPCQDLPHAMPTWHCSVTLTDSCTDQVSVVMTGETEPEIILNENGQRSFNFYNSYPMPASTFALAVGSWLVTLIRFPLGHQSLDSDRCTMPQCRLYSPLSLYEQSVQQFSRYLPPCFEVLNCVLGPYPLKHLDILVVPECFDSLGLACPHLLLLSQSLLSPDLSMFARVSHELCHTWFGILTGPYDWTEEWLTEGVCCFLEDIIHGLVMKWSEKERLDRSTLKSLLKFRLLSSEINNTPEDLQTLRPNEGRVVTADNMKDEQLFVKNGLNQEKTVMQVHYLKGFFLLKYLEDKAGSDNFLEVLKRFVTQHLGQLFSSKELLDFFFENCTNLSASGLTATEVCQDWLDCPGMPIHLRDFPSITQSHLITEVEKVVAHIQAAASRKRSNDHRSRRKDESIQSRELLPDQVVLLLERLIDEDVPVTIAQLDTLRETFTIETANAEVKHSWCELVIRRKATKYVEDVKRFLIHHQVNYCYHHHYHHCPQCILTPSSSSPSTPLHGLMEGGSIGRNELNKTQ